MTITDTARPHRWLDAVLPAVIAALVLAGCGGGGDSTSGGGGGGGGTSGVTTFQAFASLTPPLGNGGLPAALTDAIEAEAAQRSRTWAAETLIARDSTSGGNGVAIPPLYFARAQAVAAAAAGTTLAELRQVFPAASSSTVDAALVQGLQRTLSAGGSTSFMTAFMNTVTVRAQTGVWDTLTLDQLSAGALQSEPNLRLRIADTYQYATPWPQVTVVTGVFENAGGSRVSTALLRITGQRVTVSGTGMDAIALSLPEDRWLVRITPTGTISAWTTADLTAALAQVAAGLDAATPTVGDLVLPVASGFTAAGAGDIRGMTEAQDPVRANLSGLNGGGTYADLPAGTASMAIGTTGLTVSGSSQVTFIFSPSNANGGGFILTQTNPTPAVFCGATDLRASYLALVNEYGRVEVLARLAAASGTPCQ